MFKKLGFFNNDLIKNILIVFSGNAIGLLIPFLGAFWIARLYKPEDLGYFSFLMVYLNLIVLEIEWFIVSLILKFSKKFPKSECIIC